MLVTSLNMSENWFFSLSIHAYIITMLIPYCEEGNEMKLKDLVNLSIIMITMLKLNGERGK